MMTTVIGNKILEFILNSKSKLFTTSVKRSTKKPRNLSILETGGLR